MSFRSMAPAQTYFNGQPFASLSPAIARASTVRFATIEEFLQRSSRLPDGFSYGSTGTPTHRHLEARIAGLDGAAHGIVVPSGQAAIVLVMLHLLKSGQHLLISASAYGPAQDFALRHLARLGVDVEVYDPCIGAGIQALLRPNTALVWMESPGSLTMEVQDIAAIVAEARAAGVMTAIDNTWSSPLYAKPLAMGVDVCIHACTKYMGGHSDLLMGSITVNDDALYAGLRELQACMGQSAGADDCFLVERGLDTLEIRMGEQSRRALEMAQRLSEHPQVRQVLHPALPQSKFHSLWQRQFSGSGSVFSFEPQIDTPTAARAFFEGLEHFSIGASWGSVHSLAAYYPKEMQRARAFCDIHGPLIRLSIGLEDPGRLWEGLQQALEHMRLAP